MISELIVIITNKKLYRCYLMIVIHLDLALLCLTPSLVPDDVIEIDLYVIAAFDMKIVECPLLSADLVVALLIEYLVDTVVVLEMDCRSCIP